MGKPRLIIIIRHAQSEGNRDKTIHQTTPDHKVPLTPEGHQQALEAGEKLRELLRNDDTLHFFISPYRRTRETTEGILSGLTSNDPVPSPFQRSHIKVYEEPRLREQDFGNFQPGTDEVERLWRERAEYGHFFYRIPNGESGADVYDRVSSFNGSLWRRFSEDTMASVAILVTHGLCSRVFLMAWYHYSVEFFEDLRNINHCEFLVMKLAPNGRYVLQNSLRRWSDLRRERAARKSVSAASPPVESIPVRRWGTNRTKHDAASGGGGGSSSSALPRPQRKNTADMFKDDEDDAAHPTVSTTGLPTSATPRSQSPVEIRASRSGSQSLPRNSSNLRNELSALSIDTGKKAGIKSYLGRDGGGSRSGAASPFGSDGDEEDEDDDTSPHSTPQVLASDGPEPRTGSVSSQALSTSVSSVSSLPRVGSGFSSSLARALRGDFDDPNRVLADALGDQSDAEVDEVDLEMGTKEKEEKELECILAEERRERTHGGSVY